MSAANEAEGRFMKDQVVLPPDTNQVRGLAQYSIDFLGGRFDEPSAAALAAVERFHLDSVACAVSALACGTNAPRVLRVEALEYWFADGPRSHRFLVRSSPSGPRKRSRPTAPRCGSGTPTAPISAITPASGHIAGEFGHNDFYPVAIAAAQQRDYGWAADVCWRCWPSTKSVGGWPRCFRSRRIRSIMWFTEQSRRRSSTARRWAPRWTKSSRPLAWSWPIMSRFARFGTASNCRIPKVHRPRWLRKRRCFPCIARCGDSLGRPTSFATLRRSFAGLSRRKSRT